MNFLDEQLIAYVGEDNMKISKLITPDEKDLLQQLLSEMSEQFGVATTLSDPDGTPVLNYCNFSDFCQNHIRNCDEGLRRCKLETKKRGEMAFETKKPQVYECHAGIIDFVAPIILLNRRIGNVAGGQLLVKKPSAEIMKRFEVYLEEIGVKDKQKALESLELMHIKNSDTIEQAASIYFNIGKLLSNYFMFQAEHRYWKDSLTRLNMELEERVKTRTLQLEQKVDELKETQMQLIQKEKLAGIGQLAAGVAHEVNNPLGFIISNLKTLDKYVVKFTEMINAYQDLKNMVMSGDSRNIPDKVDQIEKIIPQKKFSIITDDAADLLRETQEGLSRIANIVQSLRVFTRIDSNQQLEEYDLNAGIENTLLIAESEYIGYAKIEKKLTEIPDICGVGSEINQVLLSLIVNAAQSIKEKLPFEEGVISISTYSDQNYVYCDVADNGGGIPENILNRIFEPFFTTKPPGKTSGLGLSISHDIVTNKLQGEILVDSRPGEGAKFTLKIPIV